MLLTRCLFKLRNNNNLLDDVCNCKIDSEQYSRSFVLCNIFSYREAHMAVATTKLAKEPEV